MAWLKSHQSLRDHPKTRKLARRLGVRLPEAVGILHCLWWWCMDYAPDGDLTKHDHEDIAIACEWGEEPDDLVDALVACGFLENDKGLRVHDWIEYAGVLLEQREGNRERARRSYEKKRDQIEQSTSSLRADFAQSAPLDKKEEKEEKEKKRTGGRATDVGRSPARAEEMTPLQDIVGKKLKDCGLVREGVA